MSAAADAKQWARALREHRAAVDRLLDTLARTPPGAWRVPHAPGKWTPAEIAQHLVLASDALLAEVGGAPGVRLRTGPVLRRLLRWVLLPHVLFHQSIPVRARAPRETRPSGDAPDAAEAARRLRERAGRLESALEERPEARVTHPYFGRLRRAPALRFVAAHMEHHRRQIAAAAARAGSAGTAPTPGSAPRP